MAQRVKSSTGVGCCVLNPARTQILLGLELYGSYAGQFSLCAGKIDPQDQGDYQKTIQRELWEEFAINNYTTLTFFAYIGTSAAYAGTPVFTLIVPDNDDLRINPTLYARQNDASLGPEMKEIRNVQWFALNSIDPKISNFARGAMRRLLPQRQPVVQQPVIRPVIQPVIQPMVQPVVQSVVQQPPQQLSVVDAVVPDQQVDSSNSVIPAAVAVVGLSSTFAGMGFIKENLSIILWTIGILFIVAIIIMIIYMFMKSRRQQQQSVHTQIPNCLSSTCVCPAGYQQPPPDEKK